MPVTDKPNPNAARLDRYAFLIREYAREYAAACLDFDIKNIKKSCVPELFGAFMGNPRPWEAEVFGSLLFSDDMLEQSLREIAVNLSEKEFRNLRVIPRLAITLGIYKSPLHESAWLEGSIARSGMNPRNIKNALFHAGLYKRAVYFRKMVNGLCERIFTPRL